jgi:hypothetical protein
VITEIPAALGTVVVAFTDGLRHAGTLSGSALYDPMAALQRLMTAAQPDADTIANVLLDEALAMCDGRPRDDISVMVMAVLPPAPNEIRRLSGNLPLR